MALPVRAPSEGDRVGEAVRGAHPCYRHVAADGTYVRQSVQRLLHLKRGGVVRQRGGGLTGEGQLERRGHREVLDHDVLHARNGVEERSPGRSAVDRLPGAAAAGRNVDHVGVGRIGDDAGDPAGNDVVARRLTGGGRRGTDGEPLRRDRRVRQRAVARALDDERLAGDTDRAGQLEGGAARHDRPACSERVPDHIDAPRPGGDRAGHERLRESGERAAEDHLEARRTHGRHGHETTHVGGAADRRQGIEGDLNRIGVSRRARVGQWGRRRDAVEGEGKLRLVGAGAGEVDGLDLGGRAAAQGRVVLHGHDALVNVRGAQVSVVAGEVQLAAAVDVQVSRCRAADGAARMSRPDAGVGAVVLMEEFVCTVIVVVVPSVIGPRQILSVVTTGSEPGTMPMAPELLATTVKAESPKAGSPEPLRMSCSPQISRPAWTPPFSNAVVLPSSSAAPGSTVVDWPTTPAPSAVLCWERRTPVLTSLGPV